MDANHGQAEPVNTTPPSQLSQLEQSVQPLGETWEDIPDEIKTLSTDEILARVRLLENDIKVSIIDSSYFCH